jgi:membrane peptidoglycan carboxypeptidase
MSVMRALRRVLAFVLGSLAIIIGCGLVWIFYYSRDLPDMDALAQFAPATAVPVSDPCLGATSVAIPYDAIGDHLRAALSAVEGGENDLGVLTQQYRGLTDQRILPSATLSVQISRSMVCTPSKTLNREFKEIRTAVQLERRFSRRDLFTIFANRIWFGDDLVGVEAASQHFFRKDTNQLQVAEAALLAGLVKSPRGFSPVKHPDRALQRRNAVIDAMVASHALSAQEGETARASALEIVTQ